MLLFITVGAVIAIEENDKIIKEHNCEARIGSHCMMELLTRMFNTETVSDKCCEELVILGLCHPALLKRKLENPKFKHLKPSKMIVKSIHTWIYCLFLKIKAHRGNSVLSPSPSI